MNISRRIAPLLATCHLLLIGAQAAYGLECPPGAAAGAAAAVPGKPGETGWLLNEERDDKGNRIQTWCLKAGAGHGGADFALLWKPNGAADKDAVWIGACTFAGGQNAPNKQFEDKNPRNGVPDEFTAVTWFNYEAPPNGNNDFHYTFDPKAGNLTVQKTAGNYGVVVDIQTRRIVGLVYDTIRLVGAADTYPAPKEFKDITLNGTRLTAEFPGEGGIAAEAFAAVFETVSPRRVWTYALRANAMGGAGAETDPFVGTNVSVAVGDTFTIGAAGVQHPLVSGLAASRPYGRWVVDSYNTASVTFRATSSAEFIPGTLIEGFGFTSTLDSGLASWNLASANESSSSSGSVLGPSASAH